MTDDEKKVLSDRLEEHRKAIAERAKWIKEHEPKKGEAHSHDVYSDYNSKKKRWDETIQAEYHKIDELKAIASRLGVKL
jgi:hypothetical protein